MYEKLIKSLRVEPFEVESVGLAKTMNKAADAIEELSRENKEIMFRANQLEAMNDALIGETGATDALIVASKPRWISVAERLPEVRTWVLCYCRANSFDVFRLTDDGNWQYGNRAVYMKGYVTHWMPLPEPPEEE